MTYNDICVHVLERDTIDLQWHMCTCIREGHTWLTMTCVHVHVLERDTIDLQWHMYMYMYKRGTLLTYNNDICVHV